MFSKVSLRVVATAVTVSTKGALTVAAKRETMSLPAILPEIVSGGITSVLIVLVIVALTGASQMLAQRSVA